MSSQKVLCVICAWRATCQKQFSMKAGQRCPDFARDVSIKEEDQKEEEKEKQKK